jgi:ABC-type nitrate/sulfonate/bicarbonate transport system substrate-binding protein
LLFSLVIAALGVQSRNAWSAEKPAKLARVRIAYVSRSTLDMPFIIARERGYFREEGLEPELIFMKAIRPSKPCSPARISAGLPEPRSARQ